MALASTARGGLGIGARTSALAGILTARRARGALACAVGVGLTAAILILLAWDDPAVTQPMIMPLVGPMLVAAYLGGLAPGVLTALVGTVGAAYLRLQPVYRLDVADPLDRAVLAMLCAVGVLLAALGESRLRLADRPRTSAGGESRNVLARQLRAGAAETATARIRRFARSAPIGIVISSREEARPFVNDAFLRIIGRSRAALEEALARGEERELIGWLGAPAPSDDGGSAPAEARREDVYVRPDGSRVPVLIGLSPQPDGFAAFVVDMSAEKRAEAARGEAEEELREADRRKDAFLGVLSHELRNPLAPIRYALLLLDRAVDDPATVRRARGVIGRQVALITRLVDELLDVTRISRGKITMEKTPVELSELLTRTAEDHRASFRDRGLELVLPPLPSAWVEGDAARLTQIIGNLLQNAAKFSAPGDRVTLSLEVKGGVAELAVDDEGAGIEPALLGRLFQPFVQSERTAAQSRGGLGLGLALVKGLAELHGGTVRAQSAGVGKGSRFVVRLPLARARPDAPMLPADRGPGPHAGDGAAWNPS